MLQHGHVEWFPQVLWLSAAFLAVGPPEADVILMYLCCCTGYVQRVNLSWVPSKQEPTAPSQCLGLKSLQTEKKASSPAIPTASSALCREPDPIGTHEVCSENAFGTHRHAWFLHPGCSDFMCGTNPPRPAGLQWHNSRYLKNINTKYP